MQFRHKSDETAARGMPMFETQSQRAGKQAQQIQISGDFVVNQGISEERATEIADSTARALWTNYTSEAWALALQRMQVFDQKLVDLFARNDQLSAFADPGFAVTLKKAQLGAATTEREPDYDMLVRLLSDRADRGENRTIRAGLNRAVEIVDQMDDSALRALTVFQAASQFYPGAGTLARGLDILDTLFHELLDGPLPTGDAWLDHLDMLDAVRMSRVMSLREFDEFFPSQMSGYLASGVEADSEAEAASKTLLLTMGFRLDVVDHELKPGFRRLATSKLASFENSLLSTLTAERKELILETARITYGLGPVSPSLVRPFMEQVELRSSLRTVAEWWRQIPFAPHVTSAGSVLARANAKRLDTKNLLPTLG